MRWLLVAVLLPTAAFANDATAPARLESVTIAEESEAAVVRIKTSSPVRYQASLIDTPYRLVVDLEDTVYAWRKTPLDTETAPVRQIRGSQYRKGIARVVVELKRKTAYDVREEAGGLVLVIQPAVTKAAAAQARPAAPPAETPAPPAAALEPAATTEAPASPAAVIERTAPAVAAVIAPAALPSPEPGVRAEATATPPPSATPAAHVSAAPPAAEPPAALLSTPAPSMPPTPVVAAAEPASASPPTPAPPTTPVPAAMEPASASLPTPTPELKSAPASALAEPSAASLPTAAPAPPTVPVAAAAESPAAPAPIPAMPAAPPPAVVEHASAVPPTPAATVRQPVPATPALAPAVAPIAVVPTPAPAAEVKATPKPARPVLVSQAPAPSPAPPRMTTTPSGQRLISLDFKEADVVNLLRILAAESGRNIVIGDDVKGKMSISLRNVPWDLALETILEARGLSKIERDGVIRIVSNEQLAKEREAKARVEEAKLKSEAEVRAKIAEAQVKEAEAVTKKIQAEVAQKEQEAKGPLREESVRLSYADPEEVAKTLQGILGIPAEGAKVTGPGFLGIPGPAPSPGTAPNPELGIPYSQPGAPAQPGLVSVSQDVLNKGLSIRAHKPTNTLFLRLYSADMDRVLKIIRESLDIPLPQVKIEARMEILDRNALAAIGVQWGGFVAQPSGNSTLVGQGLQTSTVGGQTVPFIPGRLVGNTNVIDPAGVIPPTFNNQNVRLQSSADDIAKLGGFPVSFQTGLPLGGNLVNLPISTLPNAAGALPAAGLSFGIIGTRFNVNLALQALASSGKTRTLARPEIVTVENNKASISLGEELPYATISSAGTQIQFKEALLKLDVTPTVIKEGPVTRIKMVVVVENNSRGDTVNLGSAGQPPAINRRKAETQVLVKEGDRLVIGGVTTGVNQTTNRKVPVFGDIPILGYLFKQKENFESGRELVIFLTPTLVRGPESGPAVLAPAPPLPAPAAPAPPAPAPPAPTR